ncbi:MAG: hypothetical protein FWD06_07625 [Oscillospiraceae bacterium]|nr:hypothetical protein [Oscillospiraceae bacterium]
MKAEYNLLSMKRKGHPLRDKVERGDLRLINPLNIPDRDTKLAALSPEERELVVGLLKGFPPQH